MLNALQIASELLSRDLQSLSFFLSWSYTQNNVLIIMSYL